MKIIIFDLDDTLYDTSGRLDAVTPNFKTMKLFPYADEFLSREGFYKILLTHGNRILQMKKIKTLGIQKSFSEIHICTSHKGKERFLKAILKKRSVKPSDVYVLGDRIDLEIRYGNMLGLKTIHLQRGKYKNLKPKDKWEIPVYTITSLEQVGAIL